MDRLDELAIFVAIVEAGSLVSAARRLRRSPPANHTRAQFPGGSHRPCAW